MMMTRSIPTCGGCHRPPARSLAGAGLATIGRSSAAAELDGPDPGVLVPDLGAVAPGPPGGKGVDRPGVALGLAGVAIGRAQVGEAVADDALGAGVVGADRLQALEADGPDLEGDARRRARHAERRQPRLEAVPGVV